MLSTKGSCVLWKGFLWQAGALCLLLINVYIASEAAIDGASLPSSGPAAVTSSATWRKVCVGSAPIGEPGAGKPGQGGMEWAC